MFSNIGLPGLILIVVLALIVFGPNKLPELARSAGRTVHAVKSSVKDIMGDDEAEPKKK